jgi:hypothetical protein
MIALQFGVQGGEEDAFVGSRYLDGPRYLLLQERQIVYQRQSLTVRVGQDLADLFLVGFEDSIILQVG